MNICEMLHLYYVTCWCTNVRFSGGVHERGVGVHERGVGVPGRGGLEYLGEGGWSTCERGVGVPSRGVHERFARSMDRLPTRG